ncbi:MAG: hypothetical protein ABEK00_03145 [Candidatus Nanohaloarchaea archaeon]
MRREVILTLAALLMIYPVTADIALTVPRTDKTVKDLNASYKIGVINTGPETDLKFRADDADHLSISIPREITVSSSKTASLPEGGSWYQAAPGKYFEIVYVPFTVRINDRTDSRNHSFSIQVESVKNTDISRPQVSYIREIGFSLYSTSPQIKTGFNGKLWEAEENSSSSNQASSNHSESSVEEENRSINKDTGNVQRHTNNSIEDQGIDDVTILLILGIFTAAAYILKEVFA